MAYDNTGNMYNVSRVLDAHGDLDVAAYEAYSSAYFSASNALSYGAFFVIYTATISYVALYHWKEIWHVAKGFRSWKILRESRKDVHNRLMMAYKEGWSTYQLVKYLLRLQFLIGGTFLLASSPSSSASCALKDTAPICQSGRSSSQSPYV